MTITPLPRASAACALAFSILVWSAPASAAAPAPVDPQQQQWEMQAGQQEYQQLAQRGEIVPPSSPYYAVLNPIAQRIASVASAQYFAPFHFILVNERSPNAFSVPGGNVYVTTAMMSVAKNEQELAGVLCHEVSHTIHHDVYNNTRKDQNLSMAAGLLSMLLGGNGMGQMLVGLGANAQHMTFSRTVESNADHTGAYICAQAGENPWGMVWLFGLMAEKPGQAPPEWMSDHPRDDHRVSDLENLFRSDPATFGRFSEDPKTGTPLHLPQQAPAQQYPPQPQGPPQQYPPQQYPPQQYPPQQYPPQQYPPQQQPPDQGPPGQGPPPQGPPEGPPN